MLLRLKTTTLCKQDSTLAHSTRDTVALLAHEILHFVGPKLLASKQSGFEPRLQGFG